MLDIYSNHFTTYCDPKSFAWEHKFKAFIEQASRDQFGLKIKLPNSNISNRVLPVRIHDLDDDARKNLNKTKYRNQVNKVAHAIKEIIAAIKKHNQPEGDLPKEVVRAKPERTKKLNPKVLTVSFFVLTLIMLSFFFIPKLSKFSGPIEKSVAVLPFVNLSNNPEQDYFSDGMVDAILDHLFKIGDLKVIARTSIMRYKNTKLTLKEIAQELGVSALLEDSVQKIRNKVRITAQLIDPKTGFHLWSKTFDRDLSDVFSIQSEVAQNVARELKTKLTSKKNSTYSECSPHDQSVGL
jgi:TolB-like protein